MPGTLYLDHILNQNRLDICALCEHWLFPHNLNFLGCINNKYDFTGKSDADLINRISGNNQYSRGKGGVALIWNKNLSQCVSVIDIDDDRIVGIDISLNNNAHLVIFSVYLPSTNYSNDYYSEYITKMSDLFAQYSVYASVIFLGDMNTQIKGPRCDANKTFRTKEMGIFLQQTEMCSLNVLNSCHGPKYTFSPYTSTDNRTLIDHILVPVSMVDLFSNCAVLSDHELNTSDHLPVTVDLSVKPIYVKRNNFTRTKYKWHKFTKKEIAHSYGHELNCLLNTLTVPENNTSNCEIDAYYKNIVARP